MSTAFIALAVFIAVATAAWLLRALRPSEGPAWLARTPFIAGAVALVLAIGAGLTLVKQPAPPKPALPTDTAAAAPAPVEQASALQAARDKVEAMIKALNEQLTQRPDDADAWLKLGRSYAALGRHPAAIEAFKRALALRPDDANTLVEYALSLGVTEPHPASGETARLVNRALALSPRQPKALALAGTLALERRDFTGAIASWEQLQRLGALDPRTAQQLQHSLQEARTLLARQQMLEKAASAAASK